MNEYYILDPTNSISLQNEGSFIADNMKLKYSYQEEIVLNP